jgi:large subunit ribosomal protein L30
MTAEKKQKAETSASAEELVDAAVEEASAEKAEKKPAAKKAASKKAASKKAPAKKKTAAKAGDGDDKPAATKKAAPKKKAAKSTKKHQLKITQVKSQIGYATSQRKVLTGLGLGRIGRSVVRVDNPSIRGMVSKVSHLVSVEEVEA